MFWFWKKKNTDFALALGGGAARGIAHIGLIRRLEEYDISPKIITGTSMGSIIGALYALRVPASKMQEIAKSISPIKIIDFNPFSDILSRSALRKILAPYIGDSTFADTKIPLKIIATDIGTGEKYIFDSGKIIDAILASTAIPGVFSPYKIGTRYYIDGGMTENLPISPIKNLPIIASSVLFPRGKDISKSSFFTRGFWVISAAYTILLQEQEYLIQENFQGTLHGISLDDKTVDYMDFSDTSEIIEEMYKKSESIQSFLHLKK